MKGRHEQLLDESLLAELSDVIALKTGLNFPKDRWKDLKRVITEAAGCFAFNNIEEFAKWIISSSLTQEQTEQLSAFFTVGETYFFRENKTFEIIESDILPELIEKKWNKTLKIWSAGCSTGEEPYSIAIMLTRIIPDIDKWNITLLATDLNINSLKTAEAGIYKEWSFRGNPPHIKEKFFNEEQSGRYRIKPGYRKMVTFSFLNLAGDTYPSLAYNTNAIDIIFCRNVLMYFTPHKARHVINSFYNCLTDEGWLIVSSTESLILHDSKFVIKSYPGAILYKKETNPVSTNNAKSSVNSLLKFNLQGEPGINLTDHKTLTAFQNIIPEIKVNQYFQTVPEMKSSNLIIPPLENNIEEPISEKPIESKENEYEEALNLFRKGGYHEAINIVNALLKSIPDDKKAEKYYLLSKCYANIGNLEEAENWCKKAICANRLNPSYYYLSATIFQEQNKSKEALTALKQTLYIDPDFILAHFSLGKINKHLDNLKESEKNYKNALEILKKMNKDSILPESDGITAGRLIDIINATIGIRKV